MIARSFSGIVQPAQIDFRFGFSLKSEVRFIIHHPKNGAKTDWLLCRVIGAIMMKTGGILCGNLPMLWFKFPPISSPVLREKYVNDNFYLQVIS